MSTPPPPPPSGPPPPPAAPPPPPGGYYSPQPAGAPGGRTLARPWMRILARFLDVIIVSIIGGFVGAAIVLSNGDSAGFGGFGGDMSGGERFGISMVTLVIGFLYEAACTALTGGSPMKLAFGMRVIKADGAPIDWWASIIRWGFLGVISLIPYVGGFVALIIWIVSIVFLFTDRLRQTVMDKVAKTIVVSVR